MTSAPGGFDPAEGPAAFAGAARPLSETFDVALLDLDGVLYLGTDPVEHAVSALEVASKAGMRREYVTNNARRTPESVAANLTRLGIEARPEQVATSAQAVATLISGRFPAGSKVLVAGGDGLDAAMRDVGFEPVRSADDEPVAVVLGYDPTIDYPRLSEAALAVSRGAAFFAANRDATVPTSRGRMPGMGAIVAFVVTATGVEPIVAGKPERALHAESVRRSGARHPLVVGDRLDTDIEGARRAGTPSLLVLTGVTGVSELIAAAPARRPDFVARDLRGLNDRHPAAHDGRCRAARAEYDETSQLVRVVAGAERDSDDALRAAVTAAWAAADAGRPVRGAEGLPD